MINLIIEIDLTIIKIRNFSIEKNPTRSMPNIESYIEKMDRVISKFRDFKSLSGTHVRKLPDVTIILRY